MRRRRATVCAALALAALIFAAGTAGVGAASGPLPQAGQLQAQASLDSCGKMGDTTICKFDASYHDVEGAQYYTASVTRPDGSVVDEGTVSAAGASFWVAYVGNGTYTVRISAWG
jgi:hypothetical protein